MSRIIRLDRDHVFQDEQVKEKLAHYLSILQGNTLPNYKLVKRIPLKGTSSLDELNIEDAWKLHEECRETFIEMKNKGMDANIEDEKDDANILNYLDLKIKIVQEMLKSCNFCERNCSVDRTKGKLGTCKVTDESHVSSWFLHHGEEAPLVPSGTIFFSGCNFKCVFCQNDDISTNPGAGMVVNPTKLSHIAKSLKGDGARNINYVGGDPIPNLHVIIESLKYQDDNITQLWNSNFYNTMDALNLLADVMDFWLPDLKYGNSECAKRLSLVDDYWEVLTRNLKHVHDQMVGKEWASLVIRHLVLPDHVQCCSFPIINWVSENLPNAMINIMGQYRPTHKVPRNPEKYSEITRRPSRDELLRVKNLADELGVAWKAVS